MSMVGDGESQPTEGVVSLSDLAAQLDGEGDSAPDESAEESEDAEQSEEVEAEEEGADEDEGEAEEPSFTIKHDGKEVTLKQSELLDMAQQGFDYTRKTMALADERKAIEPIRQQADQYRQQQETALNETVQRLESYTRFMESQVGSPPPISLAQQDAASYLAQKELYEARKGQLHQAYAEIQRLGDEQARQRQAWISEKAESTEKVLKDTLPGWNEATLDELSGYAKSIGLTPDNANLAMLEPGFWQLAHKAKAFDALMAEKAKLKPKTELPKVHKPQAGTPQPPQLARRQEALKRHRASPSLSSLADLL